VCASDGTFFVRPKPKSRWRQVYSFHSYVNGTFIPCATAYMTSKSTRFYTEVLKGLQEYSRDQLETEWTPKFWLTDFEQAAFSAVHNTFPDIVHKGCYFHFTKSIWTQVQKKGLAGDYNTNVALNELVRTLKVMPMVPKASVPASVLSIFEQ
jgi:MULE transposase domain